MLDKREFYINGKWVAPAKSNDLEVINPSTEEVCAVISLGDQADTDAAVAAANVAFDDWSQSSKEERLEVLGRIKEEYAARMEDMAQAISTEMGAPIDLARNAQAGSGLYHIKNFINVLKNFEFEKELSSDQPEARIFSEPAGVCALITPWNWPMNQVVLKVIPALAAGCTMVLKPSEIAPLSSMVFAEIMHAAKVPAGVFNMLNGDGPGVGSQLTTHPEIDMVSFTGSTRAGKLIAENAAASFKRVHQELGGKGANIIFNDADEKAVKRGVLHCFQNTGQSCNAPTRMLVQREKYDEAVATATEVAAVCQVGPASESGRHIGPVVSKPQYDKIQGLIQTGVDEGARLIAGGTGKPQGMETGYFVKPTIFADVSNDMTIAQEEIFGPVLSIIPFDTEEEAIQIANDTPYGLTNYIQTSDPQKAKRVARKLRSGMVEINGQSTGAGSPFGGMKASGNGREGGVWGLEDFLEVKAVGGWAND